MRGYSGGQLVAAEQSCVVCGGRNGREGGKREGRGREEGGKREGEGRDGGRREGSGEWHHGEVQCVMRCTVEWLTYREDLAGASGAAGGGADEAGVLTDWEADWEADWEELPPSPLTTQKQGTHNVHVDNNETVNPIQSTLYTLWYTIVLKANFFYCCHSRLLVERKIHPSTSTGLTFDPRRHLPASPCWQGHGEIPPSPPGAPWAAAGPRDLLTLPAVTEAGHCWEWLWGGGMENLWQLRPRGSGSGLLHTVFKMTCVLTPTKQLFLDKNQGYNVHVHVHAQQY